MPLHNGWLPREGLYADPVARAFAKAALNPLFVLPIVLAARFTKGGGAMAALHPVALGRIKALLYAGLAYRINRYLSRRAINNWTSDKYVWSKEVVVVTGGAGGIGGNVVRLLAERGISVVVLDIIPLSFDAPPNVHYFKCDITSAARLAEVGDEIRARVGHPTIVINNAGVARGKSILDSTERDIRFTYDVNAIAPFLVVKEFLPEMIKRNHGMVVNVSSFAAFLSAPNMVDYSSTKAAVMSFHEGLTAELKTRYNAPRVRTVLVNQSYTKTPLFDGYRADKSFLVPALEPESVADAIVRQVLTGESGQVILAEVAGNILSALRAFPHWYQHGLRTKTKDLMTNFSGRQVVKDLDKFYKDKKQSSADESTVLVGRETSGADAS
ncbi:epidermal retinal dehydrogenase 2 [Gaeumannomyces tritici R3-111a-1]|uniref:Short-chain dehydrogenase/reductase 3 n=1 Tax=Gaeumannomyces tritici (strain R3-111a-1) TaxID=644352 RepID=J3NJY4_GAET3|nr:epidermal retinal dehydrogenase 2 [Gaeumannomyces tritici R3-111a-1]EJT81588.1 epidermal retinal dehydrogenase 2 [Gaeumannomyces tritici R3-111a-1]